MPLALRTRLGPYEVVAPIGAGGMGEVYRATDTKLKRQVAIKILPPSLAADHDRLARFQREAEVLASLNHPHIAHIYGLDRQEGRDGQDATSFIVMELVEGEDLSQILEGLRAKGSGLTLDEALPIAKQIAEALEAAHERGVIHRDLKPANIKVRADGTVKVLDFGLAKAVEAGGAGQAGRESLSTSPTMMSPATSGIGVILGTAAYMAPEQARGKAVDTRADIWAFGCVLYEMVTGERLFTGDDLTEILASVVKVQPDVAKAPSQVRRLLKKCLEKDPQQRLRDIGDWAWLLDEPSPIPQAPQKSSQFGTAGWVAAVLLAASTASLAFLQFRAMPTESGSVTAAILPPDGTAFGSSPPALSPDGRTLAFSAQSADGKSQLWLRSLDSGTTRPLAGTDDAQYPFWSPDGKSLGFAAGEKLLRITISGGPAIVLASRVINMRGGAWNASNEIVYAQRAAALLKVSASGGSVAAASRTGDGEDSHEAPSFLPDGKRFLFVSFSTQGSGHPKVRVGSLDSLESHVILDADSRGVYASGRLIFMRGGTLMAQPFNAGTATVAGDAAPIAQAVARGVRGAFSVSANGTLVYAMPASDGLQLTWVDRAGKRVGTVGDAAAFGGLSLQLSPDGNSLLGATVDLISRQSDVAVIDVLRGLRRRFTFGAGAQTAIWSPDGGTIVYGSNVTGRMELYRKRSDGADAEVQLTHADGSAKWPTSISPDGKALLYLAIPQKTGSDKGTGFDIWLLPDPLGPPGASQPRPFLRTPANETIGQFSPDGRWVAYQSDESGRYEIYAVAFPGPGGKRQISANGGTQPRWRHDGRELFFLEGSRLMSVDIALQNGALDIGAIHPLFAPLAANYAVSSDGQRFIAPAAPQQARVDPWTLVLNWPAVLKN